MPTITALTFQKHDSARVSVFLDGTFAFGVSVDVAASLRKGQELTDEEIAGLERDDACTRAYQRALSYLAARPRSCTEVERYLQSKQFDEDAVAGAIQRLLAHGYLDDEAFARFWQENRSQFRPRSTAALRYELRSKGVNNQQIDDALAGLDDAEVAWSAASSKAGRWAALPEEEFTQKMMAFLARRGFGYAVARHVTQRAWSSLHDPNEQ